MYNITYRMCVKIKIEKKKITSLVMVFIFLNTDSNKITEKYWIVDL